MLEDRCTPATASGLLSGSAFIDANANGIFDGKDAALPGVTVHLTGKTTLNNDVTASVVTNANGSFNFLNVLPGTYSLTMAPVNGFTLTGSIGGVITPNGVTIASNVTLGGNQTLTNSAGLRGGVAANFVSIRQLLTTTTANDFPYGAAGSGQALVNFRANNAPTVTGAGIGNRTVGTSANQTINLMSFFADQDVTNSQVTLNVTNGAAESKIKLNLFDTETPATVQNFFDYVLAGDYNNSIFHRLTKASEENIAVLQGGGLKLNTTSGVSFTEVPSVKTIPNEFRADNSNVANTIAMGQSSGIDTASNEFFFNVGNNSNLDPGKFTVFGNITDISSQFALSSLSQTATTDLSGGPFASAPPGLGTLLNRVPLPGYTGSKTTFPGDATASNFMRITSVDIDKRDEFLTFTAVSDNTNVVAIVPNVGHSEKLTLQTSGTTGTANITVTATDRFGAFIQNTFTVTVS